MCEVASVTRLWVTARVFLCICTDDLIPVCILPQCPPCVFITHSQAPCSTHLLLTHSRTHPLHSSSEGNFICISNLTLRTQTQHMSPLSQIPPTQRVTLPLRFILLKTLLFLLGIIGSHAVYWLTHKQLNAYVIQTFESGNIFCSNKFILIFGILDTRWVCVGVFSISTSNKL